MELLDPVHYVNEEGVTNDERQHFQSLLKKFMSTSDGQKEAAKELRSLTKSRPSYRVLFGEFSDAIPQLLSPLSKGSVENGIDSVLQEDIITTLLNLSIHDNNKKLAAETDIVIPLLMDSLESGSIETRTNAAATIFTLAALDSNKVLIGRSGALKPLINLLNEGHPLALKDAAAAIFTLCINHDNKIRAVKEGAVKVILDKIKDGVFVDELLAILAMLSNHQKAVEEMGELGAVPCLLRIIRESSCERKKENAIAVIYAICISDRTKWKDVREEENAHRTVSKLTRDGTSRAKRKAQGVLDRLDKAIQFTHTA